MALAWSFFIFFRPGHAASTRSSSSVTHFMYMRGGRPASSTRADICTHHAINTTGIVISTAFVQRDVNSHAKLTTFGLRSTISKASLTDEIFLILCDHLVQRLILCFYGTPVTDFELVAHCVNDIAKTIGQTL